MPPTVEEGSGEAEPRNDSLPTTRTKPARPPRISVGSVAPAPSLAPVAAAWRTSMAGAGGGSGPPPANSAISRRTRLEISGSVDRSDHSGTARPLPRGSLDCTGKGLANRPVAGGGGAGMAVGSVVVVTVVPTLVLGGAGGVVVEDGGSVVVDDATVVVGGAPDVVVDATVVVVVDGGAVVVVVVELDVVDVVVVVGSGNPAAIWTLSKWNVPDCPGVDSTRKRTWVCAVTYGVMPKLCTSGMPSEPSRV